MAGPLDGPLARMAPPELEDLKDRALSFGEGAVEDFQFPFSIQIEPSALGLRANMTDRDFLAVMNALRDFAAAGYLRGYAQAMDDGADAKAKAMAFSRQAKKGKRK